MNWSEIIDTAVRANPLGPEELSTALTARGRLARAGGASHPQDGLLRQQSPTALREAALRPGAEVLLSRVREAEAAFEQADDSLWLNAEHSLADVLNAFDLWAVRAEGLRAVGLAPEAEAVLSTRSQTLGQVEQGHASALEMMGYLRDEQVAAAWDPALTAWLKVPPMAELTPARDPLFAGGALTDAELLEVAAGRASPMLEAQVSRSLAADPRLRRRYDEMLEVVDAMEAPRLLSIAGGLGREHPVARRTRVSPGELRLAADTGNEAQRFEEPADEALAHTFDDGSEFYAERYEGHWLLRLYRAEVHADGDGFEPENMHESWAEGRTLCALANPGHAVLRYRGERFDLELGPVS